MWISCALGFFASKQPLLGGLIGYEINDFLQDYTGKIGVFLVLLFGLIFILVRLFRFTPDGIVDFFKEKTMDIASDFKSTPTKENETIPMNVEDDTPVIIDTYTHKKDIPPIEKEEVPSDFEITVPVEEDINEELAMVVEKIVEEKEEKDNIADKLVEDFGEC